jgi:hypothetical protein
VSWAVGIGLVLARTIVAAPALAEFQVETYCAPDLIAPALTYRIAPPDTSDAGYLLEAMLQARARLATRGLVEAGDGVVPDIEISLALDVTERLEPSSRMFQRFRPVTHRVRTLDVAVPDGESRTTRMRQEVVVPVDNGYRADPGQRKLETLFAKRFVIAAREVDATGRALATNRELWRVIVTNKDAHGDLEAYAHMMASVAAGFVRHPTDGRASVKIPADRRLAAN